MATQPVQTDEVIVRKATHRDRRWVRQLECACFGRTRLLFGLWQRIGKRNTLVYLVEVNRVPAGYLIAYPHELDGQLVMYVGGVGVASAYRQQGLATRMMRAMLTEHPALWLHVRAGNRAAFILYRRLGMCELRRLRRFYSNGDDALLMVTPGLMHAQQRLTPANSFYNAI
jgi:ribosomal-protein-alanine N-acetyltransferase